MRSQIDASADNVVQVVSEAGLRSANTFVKDELGQPAL